MIDSGCDINLTPEHLAASNEVTRSLRKVVTAIGASFDLIHEHPTARGNRLPTRGLLTCEDTMVSFVHVEAVSP